MDKAIKYSKDARLQMARGIQMLYDATRVTLGPKGRNVIIEQEYGTPLIVNDGVTIAKAFSIPDAFQNLGAAVLIEASSKTNDVVGDGTTTAIILASQLIMEGLKQIDEGVNPVDLQKGLMHLLPRAIEYIDQVSTPVDSYEELEKVASISSGSEEIGHLVKEAYQEVGTDGIITVEESQSIGTYLDVVKGYAFDRGYLSPYMTNQSDRQEAILEKPYIYITDKKIITMNELLPFLEEAMKSSRPLFIICDDIEQEVLGALIVNKLRGVIQTVVTKAPGFGERKTKILEDLAIVTGSTFLDASVQMDARTLKVEMLGSAQKVIVTKDHTTIIDGFGDSEQIMLRAKQLKEELTKTTSEYERDNLSERIAKLLSGIAIIKVGAPTDTELKEKKLRIEDALHATKAAASSGIIEGGGKVFFEMSKHLPEWINKKEYIPSVNILTTALKSPFFQIIENAGANQAEVLSKVNERIWYDANNNTFVSMLEAGIIDPSSVAKSALTNAISVASIFLTTECAITLVKEEKKEIEDPLS